MTQEQKQELANLLSNLDKFSSNVEVQILIEDIRNAITQNITLREYKKIKKQQKKKKFRSY